MSQGSSGTQLSWDSRREHSCAVGLARKPIVPSTLKQTLDGERCFRNRAPICVSNPSQELPKDTASLLALLTARFVLALPLILLGAWSGREVREAGMSLQPVSALCSLLSSSGTGLTRLAGETSKSVESMGLDCMLQTL